MRPAVQRLALIVAMAFAGLATAQTPPAKTSAAKPPAKAPAGKTPAAKPATEAKTGKAPGEKLMSRDELRACFQRTDQQKAEADSIDSDNKLMEADRDNVLAAGKALRAKEDAADAEAVSIGEEQKALEARIAVLNVELPKMAKKERLEVAAAHDQRVAALNGRVDAYNENRKGLRAERLAYEQKVDDFNRRKGLLDKRIDTLGDEQDNWRKECGNRPYEEADEKAVRKQMAAEKAAGK